MSHCITSTFHDGVRWVLLQARNLWLAASPDDASATNAVRTMDPAACRRFLLRWCTR